MAENELVTPIIFARDIRAGEKSGRRTFLSRRERSSSGECMISRVVPSSDTWDVTRERINRLWSVQMQLPGLAALPPRASFLSPLGNRIKSKAIIVCRL